MNEYMASLRTAALQYEFRELDDMLLDQLVCGVRNLKLQQRLLAHSDLTLPIALNEARAAEMSAKSAAEIHQRFHSGGSIPPSTPQTVHYDKSDLDETSDDRGSVFHLKVAWKKQRPAVSTLPHTKCLGCGGPHSWANCRF